MNKNDKVYIAGHRGMVGSAVLRLLQREGFTNIITKTRQELDLTNQEKTAEFFYIEKPEIVIIAAAKVGGINSNMKQQADFLYQNLTIQNNLIYQSYISGVKKLCFLGSSCIYPRECPQPIKEEYLLTGPLEPTNEGYAIAKIAGYKLCYYYAKQYGMNTVSLMPCNLYGQNDDFDLENCHVLSALVKRFTDAADRGNAEITLWGSGKPRREFLHVDDLARAVFFIMNNLNAPEIVNVGPGSDTAISELAEKISLYTGFRGKINWDTSKPDGMMRKCMDVSKISGMGWKPSISLDEGIKEMISEYRKIRKQG